jgi:hypothetical protein
VSENTSEPDSRPLLSRGTSFGEAKRVFWGSLDDQASDPEAARHLKETVEAEDADTQSQSSLPWELREDSEG